MTITLYAFPFSAQLHVCENFFNESQIKRTQ
jgi:hypothetical protein